MENAVENFQQHHFVSLTRWPETAREPLFSVIIPGPAVGKPDPRFSTQSRRSYVPRPARNYEAYVCEMAARAALEADLSPLDCPLFLVLTAWLPRPKSRAKRHRWPDRRPDMDNIVKAVVDGLEKSGVLVDDARLVSEHVHKRYAPKDVMPFVAVALWRMEDLYAEPVHDDSAAEKGQAAVRGCAEVPQGAGKAASRKGARGRSS